jgi:hypothetical protein
MEKKQKHSEIAFLIGLLKIIFMVFNLLEDFKVEMGVK